MHSTAAFHARARMPARDERPAARFAAEAQGPAQICAVTVECTCQWLSPVWLEWHVNYSPAQVVRGFRRKFSREWSKVHRPRRRQFQPAGPESPLSSRRIQAIRHHEIYLPIEKCPDDQWIRWLPMKIPSETIFNALFSILNIILTRSFFMLTFMVNYL